jgi:hypothetical protein
MAGELGRDASLPLMPSGAALFDALPAGAVVLDALAPAVGKGVITIRHGASAGLLVIRDGNVVEIIWIANGDRIYGEDAMLMIRGSIAATVSATLLTDEALDLLGPLMRGDSYYADLRLEWVDWGRLLDDLRERGKTFVIELETPSGRGVTIIRGGRQVATYTDSHPALGGPDLLDTLAAGGSGTIRVLIDGGARRPTFAVDAVPTPSPALTAPRTEPVDHATADRTPVEPEDRQETVAAVFGPLFQTQPLAPLITFGAPYPATRGGDVAALLPQLRSLVRERLQRSSASVEDVVDAAATDGQTVAWLADRVRVMTVRGFMYSTLEHLADEMLALAVQPPR